MGLNGDNSNYDCRLYDRVTVNLAGQIFVRGEADGTACTVINIAASGARLQTERRFGPYTPVMLFAERFGRFDCITMPSVGQQTGVMFVLGHERMKQHIEKLAAFRGGEAFDSRLRR